jgi:hypothetical protein
MLQHLRTVLLATGILAVLGAIHSVPTALARPAPAPASLRTESEHPTFAVVSSAAGASLRAISIGF